MTVLSRGARVRRGGRRPGWALLTALLVLAIGASSALVFTNRVELLKLAVILALWAAVAGAFVSVLYRRQSDADQSRVRDLKLVYDLQLDREISARREYELTVESQLRRELATELRAQAADDLAELRAELTSLRTSLEILFDTDLGHRPALENGESEAPPERAYSEWERGAESPRDTPVDWVPSDRLTSGAPSDSAGRPDDTTIIDVPEEPLLPPRQQPTSRRERGRYQYEPPRAPAYPTAEPEPSYAAPTEPEPRLQPRQSPPGYPQPEPPAAAAPEAPQGRRAEQRSDEWRPAGPWAPQARDNGGDAPTAEPAYAPAFGSFGPAESPNGRRRARHSEGDEETREGASAEPAPPQSYGESGRRARSRHSTEYREYGVRNFAGATEGPPAPAPPAAATPAPPLPPPPAEPVAEAAPPQMAPPPVPESAPRHGGQDPESEESAAADDGSATGGQSVADLLARLQVQPSEGGRRRRRDA